MKNFETYNLDTEIEDNSENSKEVGKTPEDLLEELETFRQDSENLLKLHKSSLESFSDSVIPELKFSNGVLINFKTMTVHLDTKFFFDRKFNQRQMIWAAYHELAHFRDFILDPKKFMENFEHLKEKAEEYGEKIRQVTGKEKVEVNDPADAKAYDAWHTFYNCLDDVYVNSLVARGVPFVYGKNGKNKNEVSDLYEQVLFRQSDYSKLARNRQFSYSILRKSMLPNQDIVFSEEMADILEREVLWAGKKIKVGDFIEKIQSQNRAGVKAGDRYFMIKKTLEPIFEELYNKDLKDWAEQKQEQKDKQEQEQESQDEEAESEESEKSESQSSESESEESEEQNNSGGAPQNLDDEFNPESQNPSQQKPELLPDFDPNNGDFDPEKLEDILEEIEKQKKEAEKSQESGEKKDFRQEAKDRENNQIKEWCEENNVSVENYRRFEEVKSEIEPYLKNLSEFWENIIYGKGKDIETSSVPANIGEINISRAIKYYSDILVGKFEEVKVMDKKTKEILPANKPEQIKIRFVADASRSVSRDSIKVEIMQKVYVLLTTSLRDFETKLNRTRAKTKSKLTVHTEGWIFGNEAKKIKSFRKGRDYVSEQAEIIRQFSSIGKDLGGTYDNTAFAGIKNELQPKDLNEIKNGKTMDIVFEVTDGGSSDVNSTRKLVNELEDKGLIVKAFQIGATGSSEDVAFDSVWNKGKQNKRGFKIGTEMENVIPAIVASLKEYLGDIKI